MTEEWKQIKDFPKYEVSNFGNVRNKQTLGLIKKINYKDHYIASIRSDTRSYPKAIHNLVAEAFIKKEKDQNQVKHKDGDKFNNNAENLEWINENILQNIPEYKDEIWKVLEEYPDYEISNYGKLRETESKKIKILKLRKCGIVKGFKKNDKIVWELIHRLVAKTFVPNQKKFTMVKHKDGNMANNHMSNLE